MGDDVLSVRHWLFSLTGIETDVLRKPKDFTRPMWFVEEPQRIPEPRRADFYRERGTMNFVLLANDQTQLMQVSAQIRQDLADRRWTLPLYNSARTHVGYLRECRLTLSRPDGMDRSMEMRYTVYIPYTPVVYDPLEEIYTRFNPELKRRGNI